MSTKVYVGMSGGVDSSLTAALLQQQGYEVTGVYMKNWSQDLPGLPCPWQQDYQDAKRVAVQLDIPFKMFDFEAGYRQKVVDYMLAEYQTGRTPNPDIMCNQEVKFKLFLEAALEDGADLIATGHYARVRPASDGHHGGAASGAPAPYQSYGSGRASAAPGAASPEAGLPTPARAAELLVGVDGNKDQSYFLYRVQAAALGRCLMPIGEYEKPRVRELARQLGLSTADKKDSQGICFVGKVGIKDFLLHELGAQPAGNIIDQHGAVIGRHDGAIFYTIGQRHGLSVGGGLPYYVTGKDMAANAVFVTTDLQDDKLWRRQLHLTDLHWINGAPADTSNLMVRTRYRAALVGVTDLRRNGAVATVGLAEDVRAITAGQSAVFYDRGVCLGGGIVV